MTNIIFVCHGSICRSPAAEFVAKDYLRKCHKENDFNIISRAVSYEEIGNDIYPPMKKALTRHNIPFEHHVSTIISQDDYDWADYIFLMDKNNLYYFNRIILDTGKKVRGLLNGGDIEDPWYTGRYDFVVSQIKSCIKNIFDLLIADCSI